MPVSRAAWAAAHDDLHSLEDVRRRAEDAQSGLSYEGLLSIYLNKQHELVKKTSGSHRQNSACSYVERYQSGEGLVAIAQAVKLPPTMLARVVLEKMCSLQQGKEVGAFIKDPQSVGVLVERARSAGHELDVPRLRRELQCAVEADVSYAPHVDIVKRLIGLEYEAVLEQRLRDLGIPFVSEGEARKLGSFKTPDALLPVPLMVHGRPVHWIDSKATFGDPASHATYMAEQFSAYLNRFDAGLVIYWFGFVDTIAEQDPRIMVLDAFPRECHLMTASAAAAPSSEASPCTTRGNGKFRP